MRFSICQAARDFVVAAHDFEALLERRCPEASSLRRPQTVDREHDQRQIDQPSFFAVVPRAAAFQQTLALRGDVALVVLDGRAQRLISPGVVQ